MKRKIFRLTLLSLLFPMIANAFDAKINGIYYNFSGSEAEVTYGNSSDGYSGTVNIPSSVTYNSKTYTVTSIGVDAFSNDTGLTSVTIPNSVKTIKKEAFWCCSGLTSITIPNSVTNINEHAFYACSGLVVVRIGNSVKSISDLAFSSCSSLKYINVDAGNTTYDSRNDCNAIIKTTTNTLILGCQNTIIPESVTSIGSRAFLGSGLTSITIPNSVTSIGDWAFSGCSGLTSVTIPNSVISIGTNPFSNCSGLISIKVEGRNSTYDSRNDCNAIIEKATNTLIAGSQNTIIPNSVTSIGGYAFKGCTGLTSITIPNSVTTIGSYAFCDCSSLTSVTIPNSVTSIGGVYAFGRCHSLTSVTIGSGVTSIGGYAFERCEALTNVYCFAKKVPTTSTRSFTDITSVALYVPEASIDLYKAVSPWNEFKMIVALGPEQLNTLSSEDITAHCGQQVELPVNLTNENEVRLCQFDLQLPDGVTVAKKSNGKLDAKLTERAESHSISSKQLENGNYRFVISSMDNDSFTGNEGTILEINLEISSTMEAGEYAVKLLNPELSVPDGNDLKKVIPRETESKLTVKDFIPGDVNNDGSVSVTDVGCAINYILEQVPSVFIFDAADMNGDKSISVTDVGMIINLILNDGTPSNLKRKTAQSAANPTNTLMVPGVEVEPGESIVLPIELKNESTNLMGWQCDIVLPEGLTLAMKANGKLAASLGERFSTTEHTISSNRLANGTYRFFATSMDGEAIPGTSGTLFSVTLKADASITPGTKTGIVTKIEFNTQDNQKLSFDDVNFPVTIPGGVGKKCATPTISYSNGSLLFNCETESVEFISEVTDTDIKKNYTKRVDLTATYNISVYATKNGYDNSDVATATLCWIDAEPRTEGLDEDAVTELKALPVLIQTQGGTISIQGAAKGTPIAVYDLDGRLYGTTVSEKERATISTSLRPGSTAIVKIGEKSVKVIVK